MKFLRNDPGNYRVYYYEGTALYCWQDDGSWGKSDWKFYRCSKDGEPSHEVVPPEGMTPPQGKTPPGATND